MLFQFGGKYNPTRILQLGTEFEYERFSASDYQTYKLRTRADLVFSMLQCGLGYSYGLGQGGTNEFEVDRKEHLIEAEVKKFF